MKVLYFLEPEIERGNPLFRLGTVRNHLRFEIPSIAAHPDVDVRLVCSDAVHKAIVENGFLDGVPIVGISEADVREIHRDYLAASNAWYNDRASARAEERAIELYRRRLGAFVPDLVVCYESSAPFFARAFPGCRIVHNTLGIFSRAPYPETSCLDPVGVGKDAFLRRHADRILSTRIDPQQTAQLAELESHYRKVLLDHSPVTRARARRHWSHVVLLPLQVSNYFMFDENVEADVRIQSQHEFLEYVLERVDPDVGVLTTLHGAEADWLTPEVAVAIRERFPNFIFDPDLQRVPWASQHCLPHVDGVLTVSSSVGLQAMLWDLPVGVLGRSHVAAVRDAATVEGLVALCREGARPDKRGALHYLLTHYYPLLERYHHDPSWFYDFLSRVHSAEDPKGFEVMAPIAEDREVFDALRGATRAKHYLRDLGKAKVERREEARSSAIVAELERHDVISFDVFDTLITRPVAHHGAVLELVEERLSRRLDDSELLRSVAAVGGYKRLRLDAGARAMRQAQAAGREEFDIMTLLAEMSNLAGISRESASALFSHELDVERRLVLPRDAGVRLLRAARAAGKRVILVSDTYFDASFVRELLERAGITEFDRLYVSSEFGLLKKTGALFRRVGELEGSKRFLHVGDNRISDEQMSTREGWTGRHLPAVFARYQDSPAVKRAWARVDLRRSLSSSVLHGLIASRYGDTPPRDGSDFDGDPVRLGFEGAGPMFLSFAMWVLRESERRGDQDLFFLARDGFLVKEIYDRLIAAGFRGPRSHYLLASRRSLSTASLSSKEDLHASLRLRFSETTLRAFFADRFGLDVDTFDGRCLLDAGFSSWDDRVSDRASHAPALTRLLDACSEGILARSRTERDAMLRYLESESFCRASRKSVVDIGHNASLQKALGELVGVRDLGGFYFATFEGAREVRDAGFDIDSYLLRFEDNRSSDHVYCRSIGLFEFLFLPDLPSFRSFELVEGMLRPVFVDGDERTRAALVRQVHRGVLEFCDLAIRTLGDDLQSITFSPGDATRRVLRFAERPSRRDAEMFVGVSFVDAFGGNRERFLIAPAHVKDEKTFVEMSWWRAGGRALVQRTKSAEDAVSPAADKWTDLLAQVAKTHPTVSRKARKLARDPVQFFRDARGLKHGVRLVEAVDASLGSDRVARKARKLVRDPALFFRDARVVRAGVGVVHSIEDAVEPDRIARKFRKLRRDPGQFVRDMKVWKLFRRA